MSNKEKNQFEESALFEKSKDYVKENQEEISDNRLVELLADELINHIEPTKRK